MTPEQRLRTLPKWVLVNLIRDFTDDEIGMTASTFLLGMSPEIRTCEPLELFDLSMKILREHIVSKR